jgi:nitrogenase subunit NifH
MFDGRTRLSTEVGEEVRRHLGDRVYDTVIPRNVRLSEAPSHGLPIHLYAPGSRGADAYRDLADEIRARDERPPAVGSHSETLISVEGGLPAVQRADTGQPVEAVLA